MVHREFDQARLMPENQDPVKKFALDRAEEIVLKAGVKWPVAEVAPRIEVKSPTDQIREAWKNETHTPEFVTRVNSQMWELAKSHIEIPFTMPDALSVSQEELEKHKKSGEVALFQPPELSTTQGRFHIAQGFKMLGNVYVPDHWSAQKGNNVKNEKPHAGWRWISGKVDAPNLDFSAEKAEKVLFKDGYEGLDLNEYLSLGLFMKTTQNVYPDQNSTWTWVLNSSQGRRPANAEFIEYGNLRVYSNLGREYHFPHLGVRVSSGVK